MTTTRILVMRNAIDMIEGALMGYGELVDLPHIFDGADDEMVIRPRVTVGQMRRVCRALAECTRIINSPDYAVAALIDNALCEDEGCPQAGTPHVCIDKGAP